MRALSANGTSFADGKVVAANPHNVIMGKIPSQACIIIRQLICVMRHELLGRELGGPDQRPVFGAFPETIELLLHSRRVRWVE